MVSGTRDSGVEYRSEARATETTTTAAVTEFSDEEIHSIRWGLDFRWRGQDIELHLADIEADLSEGVSAPLEYPAVFWRAADCNFVLFKTGNRRYRGKFFYEPGQQHGTRLAEFDDVKECLIALLQTQADHHSVRVGAFPGIDERSPR